MLVRVEVEFDDSELTIVQRNLLPSASSGTPGAVVQTMGRCAGQMIAALSARSDTPVEVLVAEFGAVVARYARSAGSVPHTCDGNACC